MMVLLRWRPMRSSPRVTRRIILGGIAISCFTLPWFTNSSFTTSRVHAADSANADLERTFAQTVRPFLNSYCVGCHGGAAPAAQFDVRTYPTVAAVIRDYPHWNLVLEKLSAREMPPKALKQPPDEVRQGVIDWVQAVRANEARKNAGDQRLVLARRMS